MQHYSPTRLEVAETFKFHTKGIQMSDETVSQFVSRLRGLASTCNFRTFLPRALRDQFVVGCRNSESQHKLLQEDRSFDQCVAIAAADEAAVREFKQLHINNEDHADNLKLVFDRLSDAGFKLNRNKCTFQQKSVNYLGHMIDSVGLHPTQDKISAVKCAPAPTNVTQLKSFLGLIMFYSRFLKNHSTILAPLNKLLQKNVVFVWTKVENDAFIQAKKLLIDSHTLVHYNDSLPITLACDNSAYGRGCVLSHNISGEERPIAFASSILSTAQKNYSQLDKEALSIIYGLKRFHQYSARKRNLHR